MKRTILNLLLAFVPLSFFAQVTYKSTLIDSVNKEPVAFANIGIPSKGLGTVSDENGSFVLTVPDSLKNEPVRISMIGYRSRLIGPSQASQGKLLMRPEHLQLKEVEVTSKKFKRKILGNDTKTKSVTAGFSKNRLGAELATLMKVKHKDTHLTRFMLNVAGNSLSVTPVFRLNVYSKDKDGHPGENILSQNIIVEAKEKTGMLEVDLRPYNLFVDDDVFVSVEWIKDLGDATGLFFSSKLVGSPTYYRMTSQDKWVKIATIGVGLHVEVVY